MRWFRYHTEALNDPKVQNLDPETFKHWINLLCVAEQNDGIIPAASDVAFALRISDNGALTVLERLLNATLIDRCNGGPNGWHYAPHGWAKRQYKSDSSTERVKRFRNVAKTVSETAPDTETETDITVAKATAASGDSEKAFWTLAKAYLGNGSGALIGKWCKEYGKPETAQAITAAQLAGAVDPKSYIVGVLRKAKQGPAIGI